MLAIDNLGLISQRHQNYWAIFYGCVTTGDTWKFGTFNRAARMIHKDIHSYLVPADIDRVLSILFGIGAEPAT